MDHPTHLSFDHRTMYITSHLPDRVEILTQSDDNLHEVVTPQYQRPISPHNDIIHSPTHTNLTRQITSQHGELDHIKRYPSFIDDESISERHLPKQNITYCCTSSKFKDIKFKNKMALNYRSKSYNNAQEANLQPISQTESYMSIFTGTKGIFGGRDFKHLSKINSNNSIDKYSRDSNYSLTNSQTNSKQHSREKLNQHLTQQARHVNNHAQFINYNYPPNSGYSNSNFHVNEAEELNHSRQRGNYSKSYHQLNSYNSQTLPHRARTTSTQHLQNNSKFHPSNIDIITLPRASLQSAMTIPVSIQPTNSNNNNNNGAGCS